MIKGRYLWLCLAVFLVSCTGSRKSKPGPELLSVRMKGEVVQAELARTPSERERGLMFRREMAQDRGMLFVFPRPEALSFWMKNTYLPLSIAFLDENGTILNIEKMAPLDEFTRANSHGPARFALEVNQGWFAAKGIGPGDVCEFTLPPPEPR